MGSFSLLHLLIAATIILLFFGAGRLTQSSGPILLKGQDDRMFWYGFTALCVLALVLCWLVASDVHF